jgi:hypothetical protein
MSGHDRSQSDDGMQERQDATEPETRHEEEEAPSTTSLAQTDLPRTDAYPTLALVASYRIDVLRVLHAARSDADRPRGERLR